jgi:hypothetical protein
MLKMRYAFLALSLALAACGGSSSGITSTEIQSFTSAAQGVSTAAVTYGTQTAAMTSAGACASEHGTYDSHVRPLVGHMQDMGPAMDASMGSQHHAEDEDIACAANAMMAELDRHRTAACASTTDMALNKAEAQHHVASMTQWATHEMGRAHDLGTMMDHTGSGSTSGHCIHNADGSYTFQP